MSNLMSNFLSHGRESSGTLEENQKRVLQKKKKKDKTKKTMN